jgi:hypothetical protein
VICGRMNGGSVMTSFSRYIDKSTNWRVMGWSF